MRIGYLKIPVPEIAGESVNNVKVAESLDLNLYNDVTSIEHWKLYGMLLSSDWLQVRKRVIEEVDVKGSWGALTSEEKDVCIELYARPSGVTTTQDSQNKVIYLMTVKGQTQAQAIDFLQQAYADFHAKEIEACKQRANSSKVFKVVSRYLNISDASDFIRTTESLFNLYTTQGIRGTQDGEAGEGLLDFIESTIGTNFEFFGLEQANYTLLQGTIDNFKSELVDILRNGNY